MVNHLSHDGLDCGEKQMQNVLGQVEEDYGI